MRKGLLLFLALSLGWLAARAAPAAAQGATPPGPVTDDDVNRVAKLLYCPVCENIPLDVCPTQACIQWRATIREKLEAGWTEQQILSYFATQYGERVLARPSTRGINILVWIIPPVVLAAGAFFLWRYLKSMAPAKSGAAPAARANQVPADEYTRRIEQELKRRL